MWRTRKFDQSVVVLGAGFAGIECAKRLHRRLKGRAGVHVALVDKENHSVFQPLLPEVAAASISSHHVVNPVRMFAPGVDFDCAEVERVDMAARLIHFKAPEGMDMMPMPFTHLVVAMGTVPNLGIIPGMAAHGLAMKTVGDAYHLRNHVIHRLEQAANCPDQALRDELLTVVTVGAGFSGVETCAELHDMLVAALKYYPELKGQRIRSLLLSGSDRILPVMSPTLSAYALKKLRKSGVEVLLSTRAASVTPYACFLQGGREIRTRTVISTVGDSAHPVLVQTDLPKKRGRLETDAFMRVLGHENVWAIGDCGTTINAYDGQPSPPTAQFAVRQGQQCAENIVRSLDGRPLEPFSFRQLGYLASLGHMSAVVEMFGFIRLGGFLGWWVWRSIYLMKLPGWYRKIRVVIDWTIDLFFPRDIVQLDSGRTDRVGRQHYEPGQGIVEEGDHGDTFFSIVEGEVEVLRKQPDGSEELLARLGPGGYFGEDALFSGKPRSASVRARTAVDLLCLGRSDFVALADNLKSLGDTFRKVRRPLVAVEASERQTVRDALRRIRVADRMTANPVVAHAADTLEQLCRTFQDHGFEQYPVLDGDRLVGVVKRHDLHRALNDGADAATTRLSSLLEVCELVTAHPDDDLLTTADRFHQHEVNHMCVVASDDPRALRGLLTLTDLLQARIEIELVLQNPDTATTLALPDHVIDSIRAP